MEETRSTQLGGSAPSSSQPDRGERGVPPQEAKTAPPPLPSKVLTLQLQGAGP